MPRIKTNHLEAGMEVASDVLTPSGQRLVGKGVILDSRLIAMLGARGIASVDVLQGGCDRELSDEERKSLEQQADAWLTERFQLAQKDPLMLGLRPVFLKWLVEKRRMQ